MKSNNEQVQQQLRWYGWFAVIGGLLVLAVSASYWGAGAAGNGLVVLAVLAAFAVFLRGWIVLSVAREDEAGRMPAWGLFAVLPWLIGAILASAIFALLGYFVFLAGSQFESSVLASIPPSEAWREVFAKAGYVVAGGTVLWRVPLVIRTIAAHATSYSALPPTT